MLNTDTVQGFYERLICVEHDILSRFKALREIGRIHGEFYSDNWTFASRRLRFLPQSGRSDGFSRPIAILARGFMVQSIESQLTSGAVYGRLQGIRYLYESLGPEPERILSITKADLNRAVARMARIRSPATVYNRANNIALFMSYIDGIQVGHGGSATPLLGRRLNWKSNLKNPIRRSIEISAEDNADPYKKYSPSLHLALGAARARIRADPSLEPVPGYDLVRLESLAFAMATGIRIGEVCSLRIDCLGLEETTGTPFVRVATEKSKAPSARPVADVWGPAVAEANDYLLEHCSPPRQRAREIEDRGFTFVRESLADYRATCPADEALAVQLGVAGLDPRTHFRFEEVVKALNLSIKEFNKDGRFYEATVALPKIVAARLVTWVDQRMASWDWHLFSRRSDARTRQMGSRHLSSSEVGDLIGGGGACLCKATWFIREFREFLVILSSSGALEGGGCDPSKLDLVRTSWARVRALALSRVGGGFCTVVNVEVLEKICSERYASHLRQHYQEIITFDGEGALKVGGSIRPGVPEKLSEHLIVVWDNAFSGTRSRGLIPRPILRADYYNYLSSNSQKKTIFERLKILDSTGSPFSITPHQIRHWVTTAIFRSGPSESMVDLWMGRSPGQSRVYDHRTAKERAEAFRERYLTDQPPNDYLGRKVRLWRDQGVDAEVIDEYLKSKLRVMHFVPTGTCSRELFLSPCTKGLMCLRGFGTESACPSFHIDTRDGAARAHIIALRDQYRAMLGALYPTAAGLAEIMRDELNVTETLDQHILHIRDVLRGCEQALSAYERGRQMTEGTGLVPLEVLS